jgi:single-strand DNA-binding protein
MKVHGFARLVRDVEVKEFEKGRVLKLRVASDEGYGEKKRTAFLDVDYFVGKESKLADYLKKGKEIFLEGYLRTEEWEKDGQRFSKLTVVATDLKLLGNGKGNGRKEETPAEPEEDFEF